MASERALYEVGDWYRLRPDGTFSKMTEEELAAERQRIPNLRVVNVDHETRTITVEPVPAKPKRRRK